VEARWLAQHFSLHAMLDVSDGLAGDLRHILTASRVGAELLATSIPISREARRVERAVSRACPHVHWQDQGGRGNHHPGQAKRATVDGSWLRSFLIARPR